MNVPPEQRPDRATLKSIVVITIIISPLRWLQFSAIHQTCFLNQNCTSTCYANVSVFNESCAQMQNILSVSFAEEKFVFKFKQV